LNAQNTKTAVEAVADEDKPNEWLSLWSSSSFICHKNIARNSWEYTKQSDWTTRHINTLIISCPL